ncbi:MAG: zinc metalloprotease [Actinomycetota bacterium]|nr:zinc metalloprotease [Actinomycetota bacterium]
MSDVAGSAEEIPVHGRICGTMPVHRRLLSTVPAYAVARDRIENLAFAVERGLRAMAPRQVVNIPVVIHVVTNGGTVDVSDEQIHSQIDALNRDYRRTNDDVSQVPEVWRDRAADAMIEFHLAEQDPGGRATSGIVRVQTDVDTFSSDDGVKSSERGGSDPWPTERYLNFWVCALSEGLLGYAQFPGGPTETDGVVITHTGFGTMGTAQSPFDLGRTSTHEVGHWLNLFHIWGDDGSGCSGDDFVSDTPNQGGPNSGQPNFPKLSCSNDPDGDMFMNYMDYVDDAAMVMFTAGQVARMDASLEGARRSFMAR